MSLSVSAFALRAAQLDIDGLHHLAARVEVADALGQLIHALQRERGATSVFLASGGSRLADEREAAVAEARPTEATLRGLFEAQLAPGTGASAHTLSLMAWVLLGLDALDTLRTRVAQRSTSAHEAVAAYSRLIAGLVELIFHLADAAAHPAVSRLLVALVHLVQGKESAGQERAVGAQMLASGTHDEAQQQRIVHLIDAQESSLNVFEAFADEALRQRWQAHQLTPPVARLERLRRTLCTARPGTALDTALSEDWYAVCSARITEMWQVQLALVDALRRTCRAQLSAAEQDLQDAEGLTQALRDHPPPHADAVDRFFRADAPPGAVPVLSTVPSASGTVPGNDASAGGLTELLTQQSARLARMELELDAARRALHERRVVERAKGALMSRMGLSEEAAFRALQKTAMDHNRRLVDVAEATLALPDSAFTAR
jgi:Nitrate and nitrite sensing/ANTAR domain